MVKVKTLFYADGLAMWRLNDLIAYDYLNKYGDHKFGWIHAIADMYLFPIRPPCESMDAGEKQDADHGKLKSPTGAVGAV